MKIGSLTRAPDYLTLVREKSEDGSFSQEHSKQGKSDREQEKGDEPSKSPLDASSQEVSQAVESFQSDLGTSESGLNVSVEGNGPGLRVILKDKEGSVVRSFSGSEFVRLRQSSGKAGRLRGKILDQKL